MSNFEDKLKRICKQDIDIPTNYENSVRQALE